MVIPKSAHRERTEQNFQVFDFTLSEEDMERIRGLDEEESAFFSHYECRETGKCVFEDAVNVFVKKAKDCDGFVFGSPVYYAHPSGRLFTFMDRVFYSGSRKPNEENEPADQA